MAIRFLLQSSINLQLHCLQKKARKQMANHFSPDLWNPLRHIYYPQAQIQAQSAKPKIINIPVQFVGSDDATAKQTPVPAAAAASAVPAGEARKAAAVTIQRAARGFLVRKNARIVRQVAEEVKEIERKVREDKVKLSLEARERILVSEKLMALLFRLDSVRGVRDFRKRVIRRVISLQETIDSISVAVDAPISTVDTTEGPEKSREEPCEESLMDLEKRTGEEAYEESLMDLGLRTDGTVDSYEKMNEDATELGVEFPAADGSPEGNGDPIAIVNGTISSSGEAEGQEASSIEVAEEESIDHKNATDQTLDLEEEINNKAGTELEMGTPAKVESSERQSDSFEAVDDTISSRSTAEIAEESSLNHDKRTSQTLDLEPETKEDESELEADVAAAVESPKRKSGMLGNEIGEDAVRSHKTKAEKEGVSFSPVVEAMREEGREMREMMERMAVENEKLKRMVAQLCATSSEQCKLMEGLVHRVEHLERVVHRRMDRCKKRRSVAPCSVLSSDK